MEKTIGIVAAVVLVVLLCVCFRNPYGIYPEVDIEKDTVTTEPTETVTETTEETTIPEEATAGKKMVLFGDSVTQTHNVSEDGLTFTFSRDNYPFYLCDMLGCTFKNFAKDGASYKTTELSYYQCVQNQIAKCIETIPPEEVDIIIIAAGTNDGVGNVGTYEEAMSVDIDQVDKSTLYGALRFCFHQLKTAYPDAVIYCGVPIQRADKTLEYVAPMTTAIRTMAKEFGLIIVDGELESGILKEDEIWGSNGKYLRDGLHPNEEGMKKLAELYYRVIRDTYG